MLGLPRNTRPPAQWRAWATDFTLRLAAGGAAVPGRTFADAIDDAARAAGVKPTDVRRITISQFHRDSADVILRSERRPPISVAVQWPGIAKSIVGS